MIYKLNIKQCSSISIRAVASQRGAALDGNIVHIARTGIIAA